MDKKKQTNVVLKCFRPDPLPKSDQLFLKAVSVAITYNKPVLLVTLALIPDQRQYIFFLFFSIQYIFLINSQDNNTTKTQGVNGIKRERIRNLILI